MTAALVPSNSPTWQQKRCQGAKDMQVKSRTKSHVGASVTTETCEEERPFQRKLVERSVRFNGNSPLRGAGHTTDAQMRIHHLSAMRRMQWRGPLTRGPAGHYAPSRRFSTKRRRGTAKDDTPHRQLAATLFHGSCNAQSIHQLGRNSQPSFPSRDAQSKGG